VKRTFFLGGNDLEMETIRVVLARWTSDTVVDHRLPWGARASDYRREIDEVFHQGGQPILVELEDDMNVQARGGWVIDHHGPNAAARPAALDQVLDLINAPAEARNRWHALVSANDRGHVKALLEMGATPEEVHAVRAADREAQGVTPEHERQAEQALERAERYPNGLLVVRLSHGHTAAVMDRLVTSHRGPTQENVLIISPKEVNFYGDGRVIHELHRRYPNGWLGGDLPTRGFFGLACVPANIVDQVQLLVPSRP